MSPLLGQLQIPVSADPAQAIVGVSHGTARRTHDAKNDFLLRCIAAAYRSYHQSDSVWVPSRFGGLRLRLVGKYGSAEPPHRRTVSLDLEDLQ